MSPKRSITPCSIYCVLLIYCVPTGIGKTRQAHKYFVLHTFVPRKSEEYTGSWQHFTCLLSLFQLEIYAVQFTDTSYITPQKAKVTSCVGFITQYACFQYSK